DRMAYAMAEPEDRARLGAAHPAKSAVVERISRTHEGEPMLVIGQYLDQLEELAQHLGSDLITGQTPVKRRQELFDAFRAGEISRLVVSKVANFSIDPPEPPARCRSAAPSVCPRRGRRRRVRRCRPRPTGATPPSTPWSCATPRTRTMRPTASASSPSRATRTRSWTPRSWNRCSTPAERRLPHPTVRPAPSSRFPG